MIRNLSYRLYLISPLLVILVTSSTGAAVEPSSIFDLPPGMEEDDLLLEYGSYMKSLMNVSMNPCENFYQFACGNYANSEKIAPIFRNKSMIGILDHKKNNMIKEFLGQDPGQNNSRAEAKAKKFYQSCVKALPNPKQGYKELIAVLDREEAKNATDWISVNFMSIFGVHSLLPLDSFQNYSTRRMDLILRPPAKVLEGFDIDNLTLKLELEEREAVKKEFSQLLKLEKKLTGFVQRRNGTEILTLNEFVNTHKTDMVNWTRFFNTAFNGTAPKESVVHNVCSDVNELVKYLNRTDTAVLKRYIRWNTILRFYKLWMSERAPDTINDTCSHYTLSYFKSALYPWYIEKKFDADRRTDVLTLAQDLRNTLYTMLGKSYLDESTKSKAQAKLSSMDIEVGYNDEMTHREVSDRAYSNITITDNWFADLMALEARNVLIERHTVGKSFMVGYNFIHAVNAYHLTDFNMAFVTIGLSQAPLYDLHLPKSMKYGGLGAVIGHEMAHGFDSSGSKFNYDGKLENWWSEKSFRDYSEKVACLESQYGKYLYHGEATNGTLTLTENIADNIGTRAAYLAYLNSYGSKEGLLKPIEEFPYTNMQLFFLQFAQFWCNNEDESVIHRSIKTDSHSYPEFRVDGTLRNMPEFSKTFQCKMGTSMNPLKKCIIF